MGRWDWRNSVYVLISRDLIPLHSCHEGLLMLIVNMNLVLFVDQLYWSACLSFKRLVPMDLWMLRFMVMKRRKGGTYQHKSSCPSKPRYEDYTSAVNFVKCRNYLFEVRIVLHIFSSTYANFSLILLKTYLLKIFSYHLKILLLVTNYYFLSVLHTVRNIPSISSCPYRSQSVQLH